MPFIKPEPSPEEQPGWFSADSIIIPFLGSPIEEDQAEAIAKHEAPGFYFDRCGDMEITDNTLPQAIAVAAVPGSDVDMVHNMGRSSGTIGISGIFTDKDKFEFLRDLSVSGSELKFRSQITGSWMVQIKNPQFSYSSQRQGRFTFTIQMQCVRSLDKMNTEEAALQRLKLAGLIGEVDLKGKCPSEEEIEYKTIKVSGQENLYDIAKREFEKYTTAGDAGDRWYEIAEINSPVDPQDPTRVLSKPPLLDPFSIINGQELRVRLIPSECIGYQEEMLVDQIEESTGLIVPDETEQEFIFIQPKADSVVKLHEFYGIVRLPSNLSDVELIVGGVDSRFVRGGNCRSVLQGLQSEISDTAQFFEDVKDSESGSRIKAISEDETKSLKYKVTEASKQLETYFNGEKYTPNFRLGEIGNIVNGKAYSSSTDKEGMAKLAYYVLKGFKKLPQTNSYEMFEVTDEFAKESAVLIPDILWPIYADYTKYVTKIPIKLDNSIPGIYQFTVLVKGEIQESIYINFKPVDGIAPDIYVSRTKNKKIPFFGFDTGSNQVKLSWMRPIRNVGDPEDSSSLKYKVEPRSQGGERIGGLDQLKKNRRTSYGSIKGNFKHPSGAGNGGTVVKIYKVNKQ